MLKQQTEEIRQALMLADPRLSKFAPLPRIISLDDFDRGLCGWSQLIGNYEDDLDKMLPGYVPLTNPMLSTLPHWEAGSHGSFDGSYALKIATRPERDSLNVGIKRLTARHRGPIRLEFYFTFKPEANELKLSETDVKSVGFLYDIQVGDKAGAGGERVMPHLRFLNAKDGEHHQKWQFKRNTPGFHDINDGEKTVSHFHFADQDWEDFPDAQQKLCYNEIPTKVNWHYVCFDFDLETMQATGFRCNDREYDVSNFDSIRIPAMNNLWCMMNICFFAEAAVDKRAFLYLDSVCFSGDF